MFPFWFSGKIHGQDQQISVAGNHSEDSDKTKVEKITKELQKYFTPSQVKQILTQKRVHWSEEDVVSGLMLYSLSRKAYQMIRQRKLFPVPSISTLRQWVRKFSCRPGILTDVLVILKKQVSSEVKENYKLAILCFDEIEIQKKFEYFQAEDRIFPAHKKAQVAMIRGLCHDWKQPVFFDFDTPMTEHLLRDIILRIEETGIEIWAMVCDAGPTNQGLLNCLGITKASTSFPNPADVSREIFAFFDIPHLLKLIRNHILDSGIDIDGKGSIISGKEFQDILNHNQNEFKIHSKLSEHHINCVGSQRQRVRLAAQLLSHTSATAIRCLNFDKSIQSRFVDLVNDW